MYVHNAHNAPHLLNSLESFLSEQPNQESFRLWVTCQTTTKVLPVRLLQNSVKAVVDTPKVRLVYCVDSFRLWVTCQTTTKVLPVRLLQNSVKAVVDTPKVRIVFVFWFSNIGI